VNNPQSQVAFWKYYSMLIRPLENRFTLFAVVSGEIHRCSNRGKGLHSSIDEAPCKIKLPVFSTRLLLFVGSLSELQWQLLANLSAASPISSFWLCHPCMSTVCSGSDVSHAPAPSCNKSMIKCGFFYYNCNSIRMPTVTTLQC
jgi:hypothetical protein